MLYGWRIIILSVTIFATLFDLYHDLITIPSCNVVLPANANPNQTFNTDFDDSNSSEDFTAILVSNLLLRGTDSSLFDMLFRDFFLSQFFLPDLLLILGDVSAKGFQLTNKKWSSVVQQFERMLEQTIKLNGSSKASYQHRWRENPASSQSGPVLLLHFPLQHITKSYCSQGSSSSTIWNSLPDSLKLQLRAHADAGPYDLLQTVPPNATEYIFQALRPRIVFSAHSHEFCDIVHPDGTREVTVPALAWKAKDDPGFIVATFRRNGAVAIRRCSLPRESHVIVSCITIFVLSISSAILPNCLNLLNVRYNR
ncbi:Metallophosphoesterase 1 [Bienertia sinuspersici]